MNSKKLLVLAAGLLSMTTLASCGDNSGVDSKRVQDIIEQAQKMDKADLYKKAMEEINGKSFVVVANSSRMKDSAPAWKTYCQTNFDSTFDFTFTTTQPKNNQIFSQIKGDVTGTNHNISMTLIQDGSQIKSKMTKTGYLLNYIPKEWDGNKANDGEPLALQSLSKVFAYNNGTGVEGAQKVSYGNVWDFALDTSTQFMAPSSEPVGQNFLYMLTRSDYAKVMKEAYDALPQASKDKVDATLKDTNAGIDAVMADGNFTDANVKYSLAWIYNFLKTYTKVSDDGPISQNITKKDAGGSAALLVYSKFRSITETETTSCKPIDVAAYQTGYVGIGGYMYKHYLQVLATSPYPWTSCALINWMVTEKDGFYPWGKDAGGYSSSKTVQANFDHSNDGGTDFPVKNDKGYDWWTANESGKGRLVIEDGEYCDSVSSVMADWISYL